MFVGGLIYPFLNAGCAQKKEREIFLLFVAYILGLFIAYMYYWVNRIRDLERGSKAGEEMREKLWAENRKLRERQQFIDELESTLGPGSAETAIRIIQEHMKPKQ